MLRIRKEQLDVFSKHMRQQFEDRMAVRLRSRFPDHTSQMDDAELRTLVHDGTDRAKAHGVAKQFDVQRYLECMVLHGADFDSAPATSWAGDILRDTRLTGTEKMDRIDYHAAFARKGG